ncbi:hypothetical protein Taro_021566 [Colocasia esculenta]|uniref:PB1 domain-containing protein n=1 Tax=Colocasia esculenta TaxID=4460 RepID=A0A843V1L1_COLES|nr:hypothetical protein [Colocasia esculenta]
MAQMRPSSGSRGSGASPDLFYRELWHACAGPLVNVPREGERVYYFPQGHMEQAEPETDEVFAQITLQPEQDDMSQQPPWQDLAATDLHANEWHFRHIFRGLTSSSATKASFTYNRMECFCELQKIGCGGENGELRVGVRRLMRQSNNMPPSIISGHSMHLGVLATASHAVSTGTLFSVFYKPRYLEAPTPKLHVGMRFKMRFEGEEAPERWFSGTIIGMGESLSSCWADSDWRSLKVQWDEPSSIARPERISPWELEPLGAVTPSVAQPATRNKRARPHVLPSTPPDVSSAFGLWRPPGEASPSLTYTGFHQGRELFAPSTASLLSPKPSPGSIGFTGSNTPPANPSNSTYWPLRNEAKTDLSSNNVKREPCEKKQEAASGYRLFGIQLIESANLEETPPSVTVVGGGGEACPPASLDAAHSDQQSQPSNANKSEVPASSELEKSCLRSPHETQSRQSRSCTKVHMLGMAVGRAVDLGRFEGYDDFLLKLEDMFGIQGELTGPAKKWQVVYTDDEDDMMLVGDDPWQ